MKRTNYLDKLQLLNVDNKPQFTRVFTAIRNYQAIVRRDNRHIVITLLDDKLVIYEVTHDYRDLFVVMYRDGKLTTSYAEFCANRYDYEMFKQIIDKYTFMPSFDIKRVQGEYFNRFSLDAVSISRPVKFADIDIIATD